ncbi:hypothetical protein [Argonema galeatum]|uniref:hypothetical protein n=1 Tax=Argonema galeatum TaxID=2942762 RepID=UPI002013B15A|nr:hypothetical protein [Argonema galeatum]MCL1467705.1 hypothetical protein [Argonema galeatum A003/A1]
MLSATPASWSNPEAEASGLLQSSDNQTLTLNNLQEYGEGRYWRRNPSGKLPANIAT